MAGAAHMPLEAFSIFAAEAHRLIADCVLDCYRAVGSELQIGKAVGTWAQELRVP